MDAKKIEGYAVGTGYDHIPKMPGRQRSPQRRTVGDTAILADQNDIQALLIRNIMGYEQKSPVGKTKLGFEDAAGNDLTGRDTITT